MKILIVAMVFLAPMQAWGQGCEPGLTTDCDGDGVTAEEGDCDDLDPDAAPNEREVCDDEIDNDCDGLYDEGCDIAVRQAGIRGGGGCTGGDGVGSTTATNSGGTTFLLLPLLLLWGRKR